MLTLYLNYLQILNPLYNNKKNSRYHRWMTYVNNHTPSSSRDAAWDGGRGGGGSSKESRRGGQWPQVPCDTCDMNLSSTHFVWRVRTQDQNLPLAIGWILIFIAADEAQRLLMHTPCVNSPFFYTKGKGGAFLTKQEAQDTGPVCQ
jgi:hypothetical protein